MSATSSSRRLFALLTFEVPSFAKRVLPWGLRYRLRRLRAMLLSLGVPHETEFVQPREEVEASACMSIIVGIRDAPAVTRRCLGSLERYAPKSEIILVDDASVLLETLTVISDLSIRNGWKVVRHQKPLGHSRACEAGARFATRPYLCLLNSDTVVSPWSWRAAKEAFDTDERIAVTGPSTSYGARRQAIPRAMYCRHYWSDGQISAFAHQYLATQPKLSWMDVPAVGGFAFFIRKSVWEELGGFDPNLPDYGNENELCKRITRRGLRIVWTRNSYIHHLGAETYSRTGEAALHEKWSGACDYIKHKHGSL